MITWQGRRVGNSDIYARKVDFDGSLSVVTTSLRFHGG